MERCNSPLPETTNTSGVSVLSTFKLTSVLNSRNSLSCNVLEVQCTPSFPINGEVFTPNVIRTVGSSTSMDGRASGDSVDAIVFPIDTFSGPVIATMSPAIASVSDTLSIPLNTNIRSSL